MLSQSTFSLKENILNHLHNFQYHAIKYFNLFSNEYSETYGHFEYFINKLLPSIFDNFDETEFSKLQNIFETLSETLDEKNRPLEKQKASLASLSYELKHTNHSEIIANLRQYLADIYADDAEDALLTDNILTFKRLLETKQLGEDERSYLLYKACENNKEEAVKLLLNSPSININYKKSNATPLWIAVEKKFYSIVKLLKVSPDLDPNVPDTWSKPSPLYLAVKQNNIEMVKELISIHDIKLDILDRRSDETPLCRAFNQNNVPLIEILLEARADPRLLKLPKSKIQDINSLLQPNLQDCLIKSMIELGYISSKGGICNPFSKVVRLSALSKTLPQLFQLLFSIRKLKLHEYNISLQAEDSILDPYHIYVTKCEGDLLEYKLRLPQGAVITDQYKLEQACEDKLTNEFLKTLLPDILKQTSAKGLTQLSDLKTMEYQHAQFIKNAEQAALHELEFKNESDLTDAEKVSFRKLALSKTKEYRERLSKDQLEKENLYIQIKALFDSMDFIRNSIKYPQYLPNNYIHIGNKKGEKYITQLINPAYFQKEHKEVLLKGFNGCYHKDELPHYFNLLRALIKKSDFVDAPIVLHLSSPDHSFIVIYEKPTDLWYFYDINQFPRNEKELKDFEFVDNEKIAARVNNNFFPDSLYAIFETEVYTVIENAYPKLDALNYFTSAWEKDKDARRKKQELKALINEWYALLSPYHEITLEKTNAIVHNQGSFLYLVARNGDLENTKKLIEMKANPCQPCADLTPLHISAQNGYPDVFRALLTSEHKVDINILTKKGHKTPLWVAAIYSQYEIIKIILQCEEINPNLGNDIEQTPLHVAAYDGNLMVMQLLLDAKLQNELNINPRSLDGYTPLNLASQENHIDAVKLLLRYNKIDINIANKDGYTPLHIALANKHIIIAKQLIATGNVNFNLQTVQCGYTPLIFTIRLQSWDIMQDILCVKRETSIFDINLSDNKGDTPLHYAIAGKNTFEGIQLLLEAKHYSQVIDVNAVNHEGQTPFMYAIRHNNIKAVRLLLATDKININKVFPDTGETPFDYAIQNGLVDIINILIDIPTLNLNIFNKDDTSPLIRAIEYEDKPLFDKIVALGKADLNLLSPINQFSPLHYAATSNYFGTIHDLLELKADPNLIRTWDGATPLYMAAQFGYFEIVKLLLEHKANPNQTLMMDGNIVKEYPAGEYPPSPLEVAVKNGHRDTVKLLLSHGAKPFEKIGYPTCVTEALKKCCSYEAKTNDELKEHYNKFIELDNAIKKLITKTKQLQPKSTFTAIYYSYKDYINGVDFNEIFDQLKRLEEKLDQMQQSKKIKSLYNEYKIKNHIHLGHILFPQAPIQRLKELTKMAWDSFIEDYDYQSSPLTKVINRCMETDMKSSQLEEPMRAIQSEIRYLTFSKIPNKESIIANLKNIGLQIQGLYTEVIRNKSFVSSSSP
jgi:ankyrin repeat protein